MLALGGAAQQHLYLVTVLHEFCQVQESLSDLCNILRSQGQLNASDQLILLVFIQLRPAWNKSSIEEISKEEHKNQCEVGVHEKKSIWQWAHLLTQRKRAKRYTYIPTCNKYGLVFIKVTSVKSSFKKYRIGWYNTIIEILYYHILSKFLQTRWLQKSTTVYSTQRHFYCPQ